MTETVLTPAHTGSFVTDFQINSVSANTIHLKYDTLPGNMPTTYENFVAIWQNQNQLPWNQDPLNSQNVPGDTQSGSMALNLTSPITNEGYIIGYSVGPLKQATDGWKYGNICATAFIPAKREKAFYRYFRSNITLKHLGSTSVVIQYNLPDGYQPDSNKNWMGMWSASAASYTNPPDYAIPITSDSSCDTATFNNVTIGRGQTYTVAYFMDGWVGEGQQNQQTAMACTLTFTNSW